MSVREMGISSNASRSRKSYQTHPDVVHVSRARLSNEYVFVYSTVFPAYPQETGALVNYYYVYIQVNKQTLTTPPGNGTATPQNRSDQWHIKLRAQRIGRHFFGRIQIQLETRSVEIGLVA